MSAPPPAYADLVGDLEPRLIEASRIFRASPAMHGAGEEGAKMALLGACDAAAREGALRWLQAKVADALAMAEALDGRRSDADNTAEWDAEAAQLIQPRLLSLIDYVIGSDMPRDPDWPDAGQVLRDVCNPVTRGEATRLLRDMWWLAMLTEQVEARKKPGRFLASVGIVAEHVAQLGADMIEESAPDHLVTVENDTYEPMPVRGVTLQPGQSVTIPAREPPPAPLAAFARMQQLETEVRADIETAQGARTLQPGQSAAVPAREHPPMPPRGAALNLPGAARHANPAPIDLSSAMRLLAGAQIEGTPEMLASLSISKSTWNNWLSGRVAPRVDVAKARLLSAECDRMIADIEEAQRIFRGVIK